MADISKISVPGQATPYDVKDAVARTAIGNLTRAMVFEGTLGTGGTITSLPAASSENVGYTYKVITAGTYASQTAKVGDLFVSNGTDWVLIPSGDEPTYTLSGETTSNTQQSIKLTPSEGTAQTVAVVGKRTETTVDGEVNVGEVFNSYSGNRVNVASGASSHAEGFDTRATGDYSHAEGYITAATGTASHAEGGGGSGTSANGNYSHAEGTATHARGFASHSEGTDTLAYGASSHAQNSGTTAYSANQTALGKYNIVDYNGTYAVIIGNGQDYEHHSNALAIDWNGNIFCGSDNISLNAQIAGKANTSDLATVATTGSYDDLTGKPTIPAAQVNSDWIASSGVAQILNKPTIGAAAAKGVDSAPTTSSTNLVESGGVASALAGKQATLTTAQQAAVDSGITAAKVAGLAEAINVGAKNVLLIKNYAPGQTFTNGGRTFTFQADGGVKITGNATGTGYVDCYLCGSWTGTSTVLGLGGKNHTVVLKSSASLANMQLCVYNRSTGSTVNSVRVPTNDTDGEVISFDATAIFLSIGANATLSADGMVVYPMICPKELFDASPDFAQYAPTNRELYEMIKALQALHA